MTAASIAAPGSIGPSLDQILIAALVLYTVGVIVFAGVLAFVLQSDEEFEDLSISPDAPWTVLVLAALIVAWPFTLPYLLFRAHHDR
ncbi:hypothetical protein [Streptomyces carpaticus]|uniref:hypothetical protein n=1 Tax=Streptomyces carpaticus TaxID=285558 RepID=UPI0031F800D5